MRKLPKPRSLPTRPRAPAKKAGPVAGKSGSNVEAHEYSPETGHLTVTYRGGRQYRYSGVSAETAEGMDKAGSRGSYLHSHVIGKHDATKI